MKKHNFSAGPSVLPNEVLIEASKSIIELDNIGLSLIEISHRSKEFIAIMEEATERVLELTKLKNKGYKAIFVQGGASLQFLMTAYNLLENKAGSSVPKATRAAPVNVAKSIKRSVGFSSAKYKASANISLPSASVLPISTSIPLLVLRISSGLIEF